MEKVSVIIPSYNHGKFLKKAIDSVLSQTYEEFELIILDDCSTDNSAKIINSYRDKRIRKYFNKINNGAVNTLNQLIDLANGEYIALLNSDDYWSNDKLEKQLNYLEKNPNVGACFTWADFVNDHGKYIYDLEYAPTDLFQKKNKTNSQWFRYFFENGNCLCHPSVMIRKDIYDKLGKYKSIYRQLPDFEFWIRLIKRYNIHIIEENLVHFRILSGEQKNSSFLDQNNKNLMNYEMYTIKKNFFDNCDDSLFINAFSDVIINKNCIRNSDMISFEKAIILYDSKYYKQLGRFIGYEKLGKILESEISRNIIENNYNFYLKDYYLLGEKIVNLDVQYFEYSVIEKIPDNIANSRFYRWSNKIYNSKIYNLILRLRINYRKLYKKIK